MFILHTFSVKRDLHTICTLFTHHYLHMTEVCSILSHTLPQSSSAAGSCDSAWENQAVCKFAQCPYKNEVRFFNILLTSYDNKPVGDNAVPFSEILSSIFIFYQLTLPLLWTPTLNQINNISVKTLFTRKWPVSQVFSCCVTRLPWVTQENSCKSYIFTQHENKGEVAVCRPITRKESVIFCDF